MTAEEERDLLLRALGAEELAGLQTKRLKRVAHLVATYWDVCTSESDPHAAKIMLAINEAIEGL